MLDRLFDLRQHHSYIQAIVHIYIPKYILRKHKAHPTLRRVARAKGRMKPSVHVTQTARNRSMHFILMVRNYILKMWALHRCSVGFSGSVVNSNLGPGSVLLAHAGESGKAV